MDVQVELIRTRWLVFVLMVVIIPFTPLTRFVSGHYIREAEAFRLPYNSVSVDLKRIAGESGQRVYIVSQADEGLDYWVLKYSIRPHLSNPQTTWSLGEPFYNGDIYTRHITPEEWKRELDNGFDYVVLYKINDYFKNEFAGVFVTTDEIFERSIYKVIRGEGRLQLAGYTKQKVLELSKEFSGTNEFLQIVNVAPLFDKFGTGKYRLTFEMKTEKPGEVLVYQQNGEGSRYYFEKRIECTTDYLEYSFVFSPMLVDGDTKESTLAAYGTYGTGVVPSIKNVRVEAYLGNSQ